MKALLLVRARFLENPLFTFTLEMAPSSLILDMVPLGTFMYCEFGPSLLTISARIQITECDSLLPFSCRALVSSHSSLCSADGLFLMIPPDFRALLLNA